MKELVELICKPCPKCRGNSGISEHVGLVQVVCGKCNHRGPEFIIPAGADREVRIRAAVVDWNGDVARKITTLKS